MCCTSKHNGVDMAVAQRTFELIQKIQNESVKNLIWECITTDLLNSLIPSPPDVETLRIYLILPLYHEFINVKHNHILHSRFSEAVLNLAIIPQRIIFSWWSEQTMEYFEKLVDIFKNVATYLINSIITKTQNQLQSSEKSLIGYDKNLTLALKLMSVLYQTNHLKRKNKLKYDSFHLPELIDSVDLQQDYLKWCFEKNVSIFKIFI